jgi:drug/metabolite transporter (DMT)-like permease
MSAATKLAGEHLNVWQIGAGRFSVGLVVTVVITRVLGLSLWGQHRFFLALRGICGATAFMLMIAAFQLIPLSVAMVLFYLYPAFTALFSTWITGESTTKSAWLFIFAAFVGTSVILWPHESSGPINWGHGFAVMGSVLCAFTILLVRRLGRHNNIYTLFFYLCLMGVLACSVPLFRQAFQASPLLPQNVAAWTSVTAVAVFSIAAQLSLNKALSRIQATKASIIMTAEVPLVALFGVLYLGEPISWRLIIGSVLIFSCGIGLNLLLAKSGPTPSTDIPVRPEPSPDDKIDQPKSFLVDSR